MSARTRYERLPKHPGITRVHAGRCGWLDGKRCNCGGGAYRAEAHDKVSGKRAYATYPTLDQAARWRTDKRVEIRDGRHRVTDSMTLREAWERFYAGVQDGTVKAKGGADFKPAVVRAYESKFRLYLLPRWGHVKVADLRLVHVQEFVDQLVGEGQSASTVRNAVMPLRTFYRWCIRRELVTVNPCDNVELPSGEQVRDRVAAPSEALRLLEVVPDRDRAIWATAFFAGLRRGELMALDWASVDLAGRVLRVTRSYDPGGRCFVAPKTKKGTREVGLPKLLVPYLAGLDRTEGLVFGPTGVTPFNDAFLRERAYKAWDAAGLQRIGLHECRHTYASLMIAAGVNLKKISEWLGHASISITLDRYGHLLPGDRESMLEQLDAYLEAATS